MSRSQLFTIKLENQNTSGPTLLHCNSVGPNDVGSQHRRSGRCSVASPVTIAASPSAATPNDLAAPRMTSGHYPAASDATHHCPTT